jgi:hypothetical protein
MNGGSGSLYLGLATAIAAFTAAGATLDLLRPRGRGATIAALLVVLAAALGITAAFVAVARDRGTGTLHIAIAVGLIAPAAFVLVRALDEIVTDRADDDAALDGIRLDPSLPAAVVQPRRRQHRRDHVVALAGVVASVAALLAATTPQLLDVIVSPDQTAPPPRAKGGFSPSHRPVFSCLDGGSVCPGPGYPAFNSYRNTPNYGDERGFLDARREGAGGTYQDVLKVARGDRVVVRAYFNNNGDPRYEAQPGGSVARDTRMVVLIERGANPVAIAASIAARNAVPKNVSDTATLWSTDSINVEFVAGSARLYNSAHPSGRPLPDDLVADGVRPTRGALLGFRRLDGVVRGRFDEGGFVVFVVHVS